MAVAEEQESPFPESEEDAPLNSAPNVPKMQRLMLNVAEARKDPKSACLKIYSCCCGSVLCGIGMLFIAVLPVAMIVIGSYYLHACPLNTNIPIYLIVLGCVSIAHTLSANLQSFLNNVFGCDKDRGISACFSCFNCLIVFFMIVWFFIGSYWIFSAWITWTSSSCDRRQDVTTPDPVALACSCNSVLMYFAFVVQLVIYAIITLACCCCGLLIGVMCSVFVCSAASRSSSPYSVL